MASTATNVVPVCPDDGVALFAQTGKTAYAGFGNRLGWMLVLSAVAGSLNRTVFCPWTSKIAQFSDPGVPPAYDLNELKRIVAFPQKLHVVADGKWSGGVHKPTFRSRTALASRIYQLKESTLHALQEAQYYVPEVFWEVWAGPLGDPALLACQVPSRSGFLSAYTQMRSQFKPMVDLHNREPRSFMVLHVRRRLTDFLGVRVPIQIMNSTISLVSAIFQATSIPWLVLGQSEAVAQDARAQLTAMHVAVVNRPTLSGVSLEYRLIRDFFAISTAAGVLVDVRWGTDTTHPWSGWIDSSFSSVAAIHGGVPLLVPYSHDYRRARTSVASWRASGHGPTVDNTFFSNEAESFILAAGALYRPTKGTNRNKT